MIEYFLLVALGMFVGYHCCLINSDSTTAEEVAAKSDERADGWAIYVEATGDPNKYRCIYEMNGRVRYEVMGVGVTEALRKMADEISDPNKLGN